MYTYITTLSSVYFKESNHLIELNYIYENICRLNGHNDILYYMDTVEIICLKSCNFFFGYFILNNKII